MDWSCQSFINPIGELQLLQKAENNVRQAWVPHEMTHGPMAIIKNFAGSNNKCHQKQGTQKYSASHHSHACWAERADNGNPRHAQPPAHLNGQCVSTKPIKKQVAHTSVTQGQLKVRLWHGINVRKPMMICAQFRPFGGHRSRGSMQALPDLTRFASSMATKALSRRTVPS